MHSTALSRNVCLKAELDEASTALDAAHRLSEQLDRKEATISALRDEGIAVASVLSSYQSVNCNTF